MGRTSPSANSGPAAEELTHPEKLNIKINCKFLTSNDSQRADKDTSATANNDNSNRSYNNNDSGGDSLPSIEADSRDVIRVILQYLKENNLTNSFQILQQETGVYYNTVSDKEELINAVLNGQFTKVLQVCSECLLPTPVLFNVYEHIALELLETGDQDALDHLLKDNPFVDHMNTAIGPRVKRIQGLRVKGKRLIKEEIWGDTSKQKRRKALASSLAGEVRTAQPHRLLSILGEALDHRIANGLIRPVHGLKFDFMSNSDIINKAEADDPPSSLRCCIRLKSETVKIRCAAFSPDSCSLATGDTNGEVNIWLWTTGKLRLDLLYQKQDFVISHADKDENPIAISAISFSHDGEVLATGDERGNIKLWHVQSGRLGKNLESVHSQSVTSIKFHPTESKILTASLDGTAKLILLKNGAVEKTFSGQSGFVNGAIFCDGKGRVVATAGSDGSVKIYSVKTGEMTNRIVPKKHNPESYHQQNPIDTLLKDDGGDRLFVCTRTAEIYTLDFNGNTVGTFQCRPEDQNLCSIAREEVVLLVADESSLLADTGQWIVGLSEAGRMFVFDAETAELASEIDCEGCQLVTSHPKLNIIACFGGRAADMVRVYEG